MRVIFPIFFHFSTTSLAIACKHGRSTWTDIFRQRFFNSTSPLGLSIFSHVSNWWRRVYPHSVRPSMCRRSNYTCVAIIAKFGELHKHTNAGALPYTNTSAEVRLREQMKGGFVFWALLPTFFLDCMSVQSALTLSHTCAARTYGQYPPFRQFSKIAVHTPAISPPFMSRLSFLCHTISAPTHTRAHVRYLETATSVCCNSRNLNFDNATKHPGAYNRPSPALFHNYSHKIRLDINVGAHMCLQQTCAAYKIFHVRLWVRGGAMIRLSAQFMHQFWCV